MEAKRDCLRPTETLLGRALRPQNRAHFGRRFNLCADPHSLEIWSKAQSMVSLARIEAPVKAGSPRSLSSEELHPADGGTCTLALRPLHPPGDALHRAKLWSRCKQPCYHQACALGSP